MRPMGNATPSAQGFHERHFSRQFRIRQNAWHFAMGVLTPVIGFLHWAHVSEYFWAKHAEQTGLPSRSLNVTLVIGFSHT